MDYYITYDEHTYVITEPEGSDEPYSDQGATGVDVTLKAIHRNVPNGGPHEVVTDEGYRRAYYGLDDIAPGNTAYVVLVNYFDGDTFGSSGYWMIAAVKATPEAAAAATKRCNSPRVGSEYDFTTLRSWDGYFAGINSVEVIPMTVLV